MIMSHPRHNTRCVPRHQYEDYDLDNCTERRGAHKYCRIGTIFASSTFWQTGSITMSTLQRVNAEFEHLRDCVDLLRSHWKRHLYLR
jgi:hypothetical protein